MTAELVLQDDPHRRVVRIGDTVRRPVQPWTPAVHGLLRHLESVGFDYVPRVLGIDDQGREVLSYLPGESGPVGWAAVVPDRGLRAVAELLRDFHDAADGYVPAETGWVNGPRRVGDGEVVCHGDFGPWNLVWRNGCPVGILDWDYAHPAPRLHDIAYALEFLVPFRDDATCVNELRYPHPPDRRHRLELFCEAYGRSDTDGIVDAVIRAQRSTADLVRTLGSQGRQPQADWVAEGYLDVLERRIEWSRANRSRFE